MNDSDDCRRFCFSSYKLKGKLCKILFSVLHLLNDHDLRPSHLNYIKVYELKVTILFVIVACNTSSKAKHK